MITLAAVLSLALTAPNAEAAGSPIRTLLLTGHNNHNWRYTSRVHEETLEATGRFTVDVTDDPGATLADSAALTGYQLFVLDYNDWHQPKPWPEAAQRNFVEAVRAGAGVLVIHSANNAFKGWEDYESMVGLLWREGAGHGKFHEFTVNIVQPDHPVMKGLADFATTDELYHTLPNPRNARYSLLARALDSTAIGGSGKQEPMAITLDFGKGRVFATPLGHVWENQEATKVSIHTPGFRTLICRGGEWAATGTVTLPPEWRDIRTHNTLTPAEQAAGWRLHFDGTKPVGLKGWRQPAFPTKGWSVADGTLRHAAQGNGGDITTTDEFGDFEFQCDWRVAPGGNSGIMYRCLEDRTYPWETGREMQILDNARHKDGQKPSTSAGAMYDLFPCAADVCRPAGEWNTARIVARGTRIEHWLNGFKVVDIDTASPQYAETLAKSKFPGIAKDFGTPMRGRIALQDHGDEVWFRNIKVRPLDGK
ncbi:MAG: DUF1080 domain-containing protein [Phycisphaerae bacterium]|nr:DUF1080 domain-containing protein [Phycisphaerae bacterium]